MIITARTLRFNRLGTFLFVPPRLRGDNRNAPNATHDHVLSAFATSALATPSHFRSRDVAPLVHKVQVPALLLDPYLRDLFCHENSPPLQLLYNCA